MKLQKDEKIFFGCRIDSKMREALALARPGDRKYFESDSPEFLQICTADEQKWIGKILKAGMNVSEIEDIQRNIVSILRRISPTIRVSPTAIKIFMAAESDEPVDLGPEPEEVVGEQGSGEPKAGGGPYIDY